MKTLQFKTLKDAKQHYDIILKGIIERERLHFKKQSFFSDNWIIDGVADPKKVKLFTKQVKRWHRKQNYLYNKKERLWDQSSIWFKPFIKVGQVWKMIPLWKGEEDVLVEVKKINHNKVRIAVINGTRFFSLVNQPEPVEGEWETIEFLVDSFTLCDK